MKTLSLREIVMMSIEPIITKLKCAFLDWQIRSIDKSIDVIHSSIRNEHESLSIYQKERMLLINRRSSLR